MGLYDVEHFSVEDPTFRCFPVFFSILLRSIMLRKASPIENEDSDRLGRYFLKRGLDSA